jgi:hypothetical protein
MIARPLIAMAGLACLIGCLAVQGCAGIGAVIYKVTPPPSIQAVYKLPKKTVLVWVEDYRNPGVSEEAAERLGREITAQFKQHKLAPVVDPDKFVQYRFDKGTAFDQMTIASVGRALGAEQVLYVDLVDYGGDWTLASDMLHPKADIRVRVVDVKTGDTAWPNEAVRGYPMNIDLQYANIKDTQTANDEQAAICTATADHVAKLFYKHDSEEVSETAAGEFDK